MNDEDDPFTVVRKTGTARDDPSGLDQSRERARDLLRDSSTFMVFCETDEGLEAIMGVTPQSDLPHFLPCVLKGMSELMRDMIAAREEYNNGQDN